MKQHYDKILFVLALVVLCAGVGYVAMQPKGMPADLDELQQQTAAGADFKAPELPKMAFADADWPAPVDQGIEKDGLWIYGVFTPPKIWWNEETQQFEANPPVPPKVRPPFGVEFVKVNRNPYRLQLTGSLEMPDGVRLTFEEEGVPGTLRVREGETVQGESIRFTVLKAQLIREQKEDGSLDRRMVATIKDLDKNKEIELNDKERLFMDSDREVVLRAIREPSLEWRFKEAGESFEYNGGTFTIKEINFDTPAIKLEKILSDFKDPEVVVLDPVGDDSSAESAPSAPSEPSDTQAPATLESLFN